MEKVISMLRAKRFEVWGRGCWEEGFKQREQKIHRFREEREQSTFGPSEVDWAQGPRTRWTTVREGTTQRSNGQS